ncbi:MAG: LCP family protein, partial [Christensenellales bacterium]|nr:LCP family protein [Christensenellales bacterium]
MKKHFPAILLALLLSLMCAVALGETNTQVKHYLMLGEDGYAEQVTDDARTDTIVLVSLDSKYNRVIMTSILRDSKINNPRGNETKINLLYKNYGFDGIIACLERELDITIEGGVLVNFENVKPVIDALGGVDIEIDANEYLAIRSILLGKDPNMPEGPGLVHM